MVAIECSGGGPRNKPQPLPVVRTFAPLPLPPWTGSKPSLGQKLDQISRTPAEQAAAAMAAPTSHRCQWLQGGPWAIF